MAFCRSSPSSEPSRCIIDVGMAAKTTSPVNRVLQLLFIARYSRDIPLNVASPFLDG